MWAPGSRERDFAQQACPGSGGANVDRNRCAVSRFGRRRESLVWFRLPGFSASALASPSSGLHLRCFFWRVWSCPSSVASCGLPVWAAQAWMGVGARSPGSGSAWALCIFRCPTLSAGALRTSPTSYGRREVNPSGRGGNRLDILRRAGQIIRHHYGSRRIMGSRRRRPTPRVSPPRPPDHSVAPRRGGGTYRNARTNETVFCRRGGGTYRNARKIKLCFATWWFGYLLRPPPTRGRGMLACGVGNHRLQSCGTWLVAKRLKNTRIR